jgi:hypothetical protein
MKLYRYSKYFLLPWLLASAFAYAQVIFSTTTGDGTCSSGTTMVTSDVAYSYKSEACKAIGSAASARIAGGGSMSNAAAGCKVTLKDSATQPVTLCDKITFTLVTGDNYCPTGMRLATVQEAAVFNAEACSALSGNQWYIARLANGGSIGGAGYHCAVSHSDDQKLGNSLCVK